MKVGNIDIQLTGPDPAPQFGLRLYRSGQVVWEYPLVTLNMAFFAGYWVNMGTAQGVDADRVGVRLGGNQYPFNVRLESTEGSPGFSQQLAPSASLQEFPYDLPPSAPSPPPPPPASPVQISGVTLDRNQALPGDKVKVTAQLQVNATFQGQMAAFLVVNNAPWSLVSTGLRDFLSGSYPVSLDITLPGNTPPGTYAVTWRVLDAVNNVLAEFTTSPVLTVLSSPPPQPPPTGVAIISLTATPDRVKPGEKVTATAEMTVSGGFQGFMSFAAAGATVSTDIKDWLAGSYPVSLEVTTPRNAQPGVYQGIWLAVDTVAGKQLASKEVPVEVVAGSPAQPPPGQPGPGAAWLKPLVDVATLGAVFAGVLSMKSLINPDKPGVFDRKR